MSLSALFAYLTAGASSQTCDLHSEAGRTALTALLSQCDIFIDDTPLASREAVGLGEAAIATQTQALAQYVTDGLTESPVHSLNDSIALMRTIDEVRRQVGAV